MSQFPYMNRSVFALVLILTACLVSAGQTAPLTIMEQPRPERPENYGTLDAHGTVTLRAEFLANGNIGRIVPVKSLPISNLTELAVAAAKRIKFEPKVIDGRIVNTVRVIEYSYSWDGGWKALPINVGDQEAKTAVDEKAEAILKKAVQYMGGDKYLKATTQVGRGRYSVIRDGAVVSYQSFIDVIVFPDKERTEFKTSGIKTVQVNAGANGWTFDGNNEIIKDQGETQIADFKQSIRTSLDNLLRGGWRNEGTISYIGQRPGTLGKRNDVVKLTYNNGFAVEFEFADDGTPAKAIYKRQNSDNEAIAEEDHYAQFIDISGIKMPYIIDRISNGKPSSRINYDSVEFNRPIPDSIFAKPANAKEMKKDLKL